LCGKARALANLRPAGRSHVDAQGIQGNLAGCLLGLHQMDRPRADHRGPPFPSNQDLLSDQIAGVDPADISKAIEACALLRNDQQTNLVHVRVEHDPQPIPSPPKPGRQHIAQRIHFDLIRAGLHLFENDLAHLGLIA
jgi:hypothetical protein